MKIVVLIVLALSVFFFSFWVWKNRQEEKVVARPVEVSGEEKKVEVETQPPSFQTSPVQPPVTSFPIASPSAPPSPSLPPPTPPLIKTPSKDSPKPTDKPTAEHITVVNLPAVPVFVPPPLIQSTTSVSVISATTTVSTTTIIVPPLDETSLLAAVVKIQCPTTDGLGKYAGSGFVLKGDIVVTAAHVIMDSGSKNCDIIFPRERKPIHYLKGTITEDLDKIKKRHNEEGVDVAFLKLPSLESYPEARAIFEKYPYVKYPVCEDPEVLGDDLFHFGYPSNFVDQNYLSRLEGKAVVYADINGIKNQLSQDQVEVFKAPILSYTYNDSSHHPFLISRVGIFYGDSGGLAFNKTKQCVLGPHRGATIGRSSENYSLFSSLGWPRAKELLSTAEAFVID